MIKEKICLFIFIISISLGQAQKVGIGNTVPVSKLDITGIAATPTIPGSTSSGILRIGVSNMEGIDIGKMIDSTFAGWIQSGYGGIVPDPLSLQPMGGNVGIGTVNPINILTVAGNANITGNVGIGIASPSNKLSVSGNANVTGTIAIGTSSPNTSAQLEVSSIDKGFLPPRMTFAQRNSIASPAAGLMVWCTNCGIYGQIHVFNGSSWRNMAGGIALGIPVIGDKDGGGIIAYILQPGDPGYVAGETHGLIVAPYDQSTGAGSVWGCYPTNLSGAQGTAIGTGNQNTMDIVTGCADSGIPARVCNDLELDGYNDWYLPSKDELNKLYINRTAIGGFTDNIYWSSSEFDGLTAWRHHFTTGTQGNNHKGSIFPFRAIRKF